MYQNPTDVELCRIDTEGEVQQVASEREVLEMDWQEAEVQSGSWH